MVKVVALWYVHFVIFEKKETNATLDFIFMTFFVSKINTTISPVSFQALVGESTGAVFGVAAWNLASEKEPCVVVGVYCHPQAWSQARELVNALKIPARLAAAPYVYIYVSLFLPLLPFPRLPQQH